MAELGHEGCPAPGPIAGKGGVCLGMYAAGVIPKIPLHQSGLAINLVCAVCRLRSAGTTETTTKTQQTTTPKNHQKKTNKPCARMRNRHQNGTHTDGQATQQGDFRNQTTKPTPEANAT